MRALFDDMSRIHHKDEIGVLDRRKAVRDNKARPALHELGKGVLHQVLGAGVDVARRLVKNEHGRTADHDARDAKELLLPLGHSALAADDGIIPLGQAADKAVRMHRLGRRDHLLFRTIGIAHAQVFAHGGALQPRLLQHHAVVLAQGRARHVAHIHAVHGNASAVHIVKAHQKIDDRRFSAPRRPDNGDALARSHIHIEMLDEFLFGAIREAHVGEGHLAFRSAELLFAFVGGLFLLPLERKDTSRTGERVLEFGEHFGDLVEGLGVLVAVGKAGRERAHRKRRRCPRRGNGKQCARERNACIDKRVDEPRHGVGRGGKEDSAQSAFAVFLILLVKEFRILVLMRIRLDDAQIADRLVDERRLFGAHFRLALEGLVSARGDEPRREERERRDEHDDKRNFPTQDKEDDEHAENGDDARKELGKSEQKSVGELFRIGEHDARDLAVGMRVKELQGQALKLAERVHAHAGEQMIDNAVIDETHEVLRRKRRRDAHTDGDEDAQNTHIIHLSRAENIVDRTPDKEGNGELCRHADERAEHGDDKQRRIRSQIPQNTAEGFAFVHNEPSFSCEAAISR